ncbi:restriction endonuclease subunit S [Actimicrobium antarcticum]|uniref:Type I restriction modification DNA specificity domain-containing protein n=1 Tax=Actimicrobium antarcticum TaxID=1051899 RepID=A0ABP7TDG4_9BURK
MKMHELFAITVAKSKSTDDYVVGEVPFVTNTEINNGVVRYVEPFDEDKVFKGPAICISGLGYATVHYGEFLPKGNGGDSCTILKPKNALKKSEVLYYAALFNTLHSWRFSFGRKASRRRLENLEMRPLHTKAPIKLLAEIEANNNMMSSLLAEKEAQLRDG